MYKFRQIFRLDFINLVTNPMWIFFNAPFPFLMVLILGFLTSGDWGQIASSYDYYGITMIVYAALNTATISANSLMEERIKGGNLRIIHAPVSPFAIHFSKTAASFAFCSICHLATAIALHAFAGVHYGGEGLWGVIAILLLLEFFSSALGVAMCALFKSENVANQILSLAVTALAIFGGLFFRVDALGKSAERASDVIPVKNAVKAIFKLVWDGDWSMVPATVLALAVSGAALVGASSLLFKTEDYI